jgi:hypothetical protein
MDVTATFCRTSSWWANDLLNVLEPMTWLDGRLQRDGLYQTDERFDAEQIWQAPTSSLTASCPLRLGRSREEQ